MTNEERNTSANNGDDETLSDTYKDQPPAKQNQNNNGKDK